MRRPRFGSPKRRKFRTHAILCMGGLLAAIAVFHAPAHALKVATWNLLSYTNPGLSARQPHFRTVMAALDPDIIVVQEINSAAARDSFLLNVLNVVQPGQWSGSSLVSVGAGEGMAIFYKQAKVSIFNVTTVATGGPRSVMLVGVRPNGYGPSTFFRVYSTHFKAGSTSSDIATRGTEGSGLRNHLNTVPASQPFIVGGDFNLQGSNEAGFQRLIESQTDNDGRCFDPLNLIGTWNNNASIAAHHSQSPCLSSCVGSSGGMDDRFDLWLNSSTMIDWEGFDFLPGTYVTFGNDGQHFNQAIDGGGFNNAVGLTVAAALRQAADHLPIMITIQVPAKIAAVHSLNLGRAIVGGLASSPFWVSNIATPPADELDYSFSATAGFISEDGAFVLLPFFPRQHFVQLATDSPGVKIGTLTITSDDPDSSSKQIQLSGTVLRQAAASLDSLSSQSSMTLDLGEHTSGEFEDSEVRIHNFGYDALQAGLQVSAANISGGAGHFSVVGGTVPILLEGVGETYTVRFDDDGTTADSTYEATLSFDVADEALPGAQTHAPLTVTLRATPLSDPVDVPLDLPVGLRFHPVRPNPAHDGTWVGFDLPAPSRARLQVFDLTGRRVRVLASGQHGAGTHQRLWRGDGENGSRLPAGIYLVRFDTPGFSRTQRMVLLP